MILANKNIIFFCLIFSFGLCYLFLSYFIKLAKKNKVFQPIYKLAPSSHLKKANTLTMGGVFIVISAVIASQIFISYIDLRYLIIPITLVLFCAIGVIDDFCKIKFNKNNFLKPHIKFFFQVICSAIILYVIGAYSNIKDLTQIKILGSFFIELGWFYYFFAAFLIVGSSNAVNLSDGLDGLATMLSLSAFFPLLLIGIAQNSLNIVVQIVALIGACLGFLWFNTKPAQIFMGDSGSLTLGAAIAVISILLKSEIFLIFFGFLFAVETLSVILQVTYFKISGGKRLFKMSPIHHHFELSGLLEEKIVSRFFILSILISAFGFYIYSV